MISYARREGLTFNGETVYEAGPAALTARRPDGAQLEIPWSAVTGLRLRHAGTRWRPNRRLLTISSPAAIANIDNLHFAGIGRYERRDSAFAEFACTLADHVAENAPDAQMALGDPCMTYIVQAGLMAGVLAGAGVVIFGYFLPVGGWALAALGGLTVAIFWLPWAARRLWARRPRRADAQALKRAAREPM